MGPSDVQVDMVVVQLKTAASYAAPRESCTGDVNFALTLCDAGGAAGTSTLSASPHSFALPG